MNNFLEKRPWGNFQQFTKNEKTTVKIITVMPKRLLSLQYHKKRKEFWKILEGDCVVQIGDEKIKAKIGDEFVINKKEKHRIIGGTKTSKVLEISYGVFEENDIVRLEDKYGRI